MNADIGADFRQFENQGGSRVSLSFHVGINYTPTAKTSISVEAGQSEQSSLVLGSQNFTSTGLSLSLRQKLTEKLSLGLTGGYEALDYYDTADGLTPVAGVVGNRKDDHYVGRIGLDYDFNRRFRASVFYLHRENISNQAFGEFKINQVGGSVTARF